MSAKTSWIFFPSNAYGFIHLPLIGLLYLGTILKREGHRVRLFIEELGCADLVVRGEAEAIIECAVEGGYPQGIVEGKPDFDPQLVLLR